MQRASEFEQYATEIEHWLFPHALIALGSTGQIFQITSLLLQAQWNSILKTFSESLKQDSRGSLIQRNITYTNLRFGLLKIGAPMLRFTSNWKQILDISQLQRTSKTCLPLFKRHITHFLIFSRQLPRSNNHKTKWQKISNTSYLSFETLPLAWIPAKISHARFVGYRASC